MSRSSLAGDLQVGAGQVVEGDGTGSFPGDSEAEAHKKSQHVVSIDSGRNVTNRKPDGPQPPANAGRFSSHKFTRRSFVSMFVIGTSVRRIARHHNVAEVTVENELRANLKQAA